MRGFSTQMCFNSNFDDRIQNLGFLRTTENPIYVFFYLFLSANTIFWGKSLQKCVLVSVQFHFLFFIPNRIVILTRNQIYNSTFNNIPVIHFTWFKVVK